MEDTEDFVLKLPQNEAAEDQEECLRQVTLADDNRTLLLNGETKYKIHLPKNLPIKRSREQIEIVQDCIYDGCDKYDIFYVSEDNVVQLAKEVVSQTFERSDLRRNEGEEERLRNGEIVIDGADGGADGKKRKKKPKKGRSGR
jgi:hypothetical protein